MLPGEYSFAAIPPVTLQRWNSRSAGFSGLQTGTRRWRRESGIGWMLTLDIGEVSETVVVS